MTELEIKTRTRGSWTKVYADDDGRDVSHLSYGPQHVRIGPATTLRVAGIGGVATGPQYRRQGLARRVFARAMQDMQAEGYSCVGLYTGTDIVAHRLYRSFGFVDIMAPQPAVKLLDPGAFVADRLSRLIARLSQRDQEIATWRCSLALHLAPDPPLYFRIHQAEVHLLDPPPDKPDLVVSTSCEALIRLCWGTVSARSAARSGLLRGRGAPDHWRKLLALLDSHYAVINEGSL